MWQSAVGISFSLNIAGLAFFYIKVPTLTIFGYEAFVVLALLMTIGLWKDTESNDE